MAWNREGPAASVVPGTLGSESLADQALSLRRVQPASHFTSPNSLRSERARPSPWQSP